MLSANFYFVFALLAICFYAVRSSCLRPKNFPPGPKWLPLIGCLPVCYKLKKKCGYLYLAVDKLAQSYGPIMGLKLGRQQFVVISTHDLVKKVLLKEEFCGRPDGFFFRVRSFGKVKGVLFADGPVWSQTRRFAMRHFRAFGIGQEKMVQQLTAEAQGLVDFLLASSKSGSVAMHKAFDVAVLNALWTTFAGHRFEYEHDKLNEILPIVHEVFKLNDTLGGIISHMPFLRFVLPGVSGYSELMAVLRRFWSFFGEEIDEHEVSLPKDKPRDLIDAFLMEMRTGKGAGSEEERIFDRENLLTLCLDLFLAGSKTTSDTLAALFAYLTQDPTWTKQLQQELDEVVGRDRSPTLADMSALPKLEAFLAEAQRWLPLAPLGVPHKAIKDVMLDGYFIPKDTIVLLNYHSVHNDKVYWVKPEEFQPRRFLDSEGKFRQNNAAMPFGLGKRRCMGEGLARSSLFLFFAYVLHHLEFELAPGSPVPDLSGQDGFLISPKPYNLVFSARARTTE